MMEVISFIIDLGYSSLNTFWFPVMLWTVLALAVVALFRLIKNINPLYQYHLRLALVLALPASLLFSGLAGFINEWISQHQPVLSSLIVIENPITVTEPSAGDSAMSFLGSTGFWIGIMDILLAAGSIAGVGLVFRHIKKLRAFTHRLPECNLLPTDRLSKKNRALMNRLARLPELYYSKEISVPFTYGWLRPVMVIPLDIVSDVDKLNMAVRHELLHIYRHDYPLKAATEMVKRSFWFHPLLYLLDRQISEYREISCDREVLQDNTISRRKYARLLFDLAPRNVYDPHVTVSMAVNASTLKKRIRQMNEFSYNHSSNIRSIVLSAALLFATIGFISCSDLANDGITKSELDEAQKEIAAPNKPGQEPLYVINGEILDKEKRHIMGRIKSEYIRHIEVLKGQEAIDRYGEKGKNGVVIMELVDKEAAFNDLKSPEEMKKSVTEQDHSGGDYYVMVEEMPELKGGMSSLFDCIEYPEKAQDAGIEGRVIVQFIVNKQGEVENPKVVRGIGGGADQEALRCVEQLEFEPGTQRGQPVRVQYSLPVVFKLGD